MNSVFEIPPIGKLPLNPTPRCQRASQAREKVYLQIVYLEGSFFVPISPIKRSSLALIVFNCCWLVQYENSYLTLSKRVIRQVKLIFHK